MLTGKKIPMAALRPREPFDDEKNIPCLKALIRRHGTRAHHRDITTTINGMPTGTIAGELFAFLVREIFIRDGRTETIRYDKFWLAILNRFDDVMERLEDGRWVQVETLAGTPLQGYTSMRAFVSGAEAAGVEIIPGWGPWKPQAPEEPEGDEPEESHGEYEGGTGPAGSRG